MASNAKYYAIFKMSALNTLKNYKLLIGLCIFEIISLMIFANLWKVAATRFNATSLDPHLLLWYITFNQWVLIAVPDIQLDIEHELRTGQLAYFLPRPISYLSAKLAEGSGALLPNLIVLGLSAFLFSYFYTGSFPLPLFSLSLAIALSFFAAFLSLIFTMVIGLSAFFIHEVEPCRWVWEKLLFIFGGLMIPLFSYPDWIQSIAFWTPFPAILGGRSSLIFHFDLPHILSLVSSLILWSSLGLAILYFLFHKGLKQLNIDGG